MTRITTYNISGTVSSNTATASTSPIIGKVLAVQVKRPNSCAVTLKSDDELVTQTIVDLSAASTDVAIYPRVAVQDNANSDVTFDGTNEIYEPFVVNGKLKMDVSSGTNDDVIEMSITVEEY